MSAKTPVPPLSGDPCAVPDWRWRAAQQLLLARGVRPTASADPLLFEAFQFLGLRARGPAAALVAAERHPRIACAESLWRDYAARSKIMILAVANTPAESIAELVERDAATVGLVEGLFFDVRAGLRATSWVHAAVIAPLERSGDVELAGKLKVALYAGPVMATALIRAACRVPREEAERLLAQELLLHVKFQAALDYPLTDQQQLEFVEMCLDHQRRRQALDLRKAEFAHRCERDLWCREQQRARQATPSAQAAANESPAPHVARAEVA